MCAAYRTVFVDGFEEIEASQSEFSFHVESESPGEGHVCASRRCLTTPL